MQKPVQCACHACKEMATACYVWLLEDDFEVNVAVGAVMQQDSKHALARVVDVQEQYGARFSSTASLTPH
jgi:hypothetical protein